MAVEAAAEDPPASLSAALQAGWLWLAIRCDNCGHKASKRLDQFTVAQARLPPLADVLEKLRCTACLSRNVTASLARWDMRSGQPFACECVLK